MSINKAIKNCSCFLLVLTHDAQASNWIPKETERAVHYGKKIIPVLPENIELNDEFEMYISTDQISLIDKIDENTKEIKDLISALKMYTKSTETEKAAEHELPKIKDTSLYHNTVNTENRYQRKIT